MNKIAYANLTTEQQENLKETFDKIRFKLSYGIDAENEEDARQKMEAKIYAKLQSGKRLSQKEMNYLRQNNPKLYMQAVRVEQKRKELETRLENANSKEEVQKIFSSAMGSVRKDDPAKQYVIAAIEETVKEFKKSEQYKKLPETEEQAEKQSTEKEKKNILYEFGTNSYQMAYEEDNMMEVVFNVVT